MISAATYDVLFKASPSHAKGAKGSFWLTDMDVNNGGDESTTFKIWWLPRDTDNSAPTQSEEFTLKAGEVRRFLDVVNTVFAIEKGYGAVAVTSDSGELFICIEEKRHSPARTSLQLAAADDRDRAGAYGGRRRMG